MIHRKKSRSQPMQFVLFAVGLMLALFVLIVTIKIVIPPLVTLKYQSTLDTTTRVTFPDIDTSGFSDQQSALLTLLQEQYEHPKPGTFYSQGAVESWCADFISWNLHEIGMPLANPNNGAWRIPGTYTLAEYYQSIGNFYAADTYTPSFGDVAIYRGDRYMGDHTNFVLSVADGQLTTIGGNEDNAIHIQTLPFDNTRSIVGFAKTF